MDEKKDYTATQEQFGKICQSIGTSRQNCHYALFGKTENMLLWGYS